MQDPSKEITNSTELLLLDKPIQSDSEDKLERSKIIDAIKDRIDSHKSTESITIGIEGSWGSGKTSIIHLLLNKFDKKWKDIDRHNIEYPDDNRDVNKIKLFWTCISINMNFYSYKSKKIMIINYIFVHNKSHRNKKHDSSNKPLIIFFNPWNYSNNGQILNDFFRSIYSTIKKENKCIADMFKKYASEYVPNITSSKHWGIGGSLSIWPFGVSARFSKTITQKPVYESKDLLVKTLELLNKKILIIIDDIDRLDADETLLILKLTKIVADFPNMVFILAYDKDKTIRKIDTKFEGNPTSEEGIGDNFIDKIVQYHFHIPKTHTFIYGNYFSGLVEEISKYSNIEMLDKNTWDSVYSNYLYALLHTPRHAKQYIKNIRIGLDIINAEEIDVLDFLLIEALRIYAIDVYNSVKIHILKLIQGDGTILADKEYKQQYHESLLQEICDKVPASNKNIIISILSYLFPHPNDRYKYSLRICTKSNFDKYFTMSLDPIDISELEIGILNNKLNEGSNAFVEYANKFRGIEYMNRIIACQRIISTIGKNDDTRLTNLLLSLCELSDNYVWALEDQDIESFIDLILEKFDDYNIRNKTLFSAIENVNISHSYLYLLTILHNDPKQKKLLSDNYLNVPHRISIQKLKYEFEVSGSLVNRNNLIFILDFWFKHGKGNDLVSAIAFAHSLLKSKNTLIKLLQNYVDSTTSPTKIDRNKLLKYFSNISIVDNAVSKLDKNELNSDEKKIIDWYENALNISSEKDTGKTDT